jgi:hypothetical protein
MMFHTAPLRLKPPLSECPSCQYSLCGLPAPHRCPECGLAYDAHTFAWVIAQPPSLTLTLVIATLVAVVSARLLSRRWDNLLVVFAVGDSVLA